MGVDTTSIVGSADYGGTQRREGERGTGGRRAGAEDDGREVGYGDIVGIGWRRVKRAIWGEG